MAFFLSQFGYKLVDVDEPNHGALEVAQPKTTGNFQSMSSSSSVVEIHNPNFNLFEELGGKASQKIDSTKQAGVDIATDTSDLPVSVLYPGVDALSFLYSSRTAETSPSAYPLIVNKLGAIGVDFPWDISVCNKAHVDDRKDLHPFTESCLPCEHDLTTFRNSVSAILTRCNHEEVACKTVHDQPVVIAPKCEERHLHEHGIALEPGDFVQVDERNAMFKLVKDWDDDDDLGMICISFNAKWRDFCMNEDPDLDFEFFSINCENFDGKAFPELLP